MATFGNAIKVGGGVAASGSGGGGSSASYAVPSGSYAIVQFGSAGSVTTTTITVAGFPVSGVPQQVYVGSGQTVTISVATSGGPTQCYITGVLLTNS